MIEEQEREFAAILAEAKCTERVETLAGFRSNPGLMKLLSVWHLVHYEIRPPESPAPDADGTLRWMWLWDWWWSDAHEIGELCGLDARTVKRVIRQAILARLVYPDGTLPAAARAALKSQAAKMAGVKLRLRGGADQ